MYRIISSQSSRETINSLEKAIIEYNCFYPNMIGYLGIVDQIDKSFWLVNHANIYATRTGYSFNTVRRFEGTVIDHKGQTIIEGEFKLRPVYKIVNYMVVLFIIGINILANYFGLRMIESLKLIFYSCIMLLVFTGIVVLKIRSTSENEEKILDFIEGVVR